MSELPMDAAIAEKPLDDDTIFEGRFLKVHRLTVNLPDGRQAHREMIKHPGASAMVTLDSEGNIVLERQWRAPAGKAFWEIPAGKIDPQEDPWKTAQRELQEEAGLIAQSWVFLGTIHNAIGYSDEHIEIYLAQDLTETSQSLDDNEFLTLVKMPWQEALAMTRDGRITDVKTVIGLQWLQAYMEGALPQAKVLTHA